METKKISYLQRHEIAKLLRYLKRHDYELYAIIYLSYCHGMRASEVLDLKGSDFEFPVPPDHEARIFIRRKKGSIQSSSIMNKEEVLIVKTIMNKSKSSRLFLMSRATLDRKIKAVFKKLMLPPEKAHHHIFKHTLAVHLLQQGVDIFTIKNILGHKDIKNTLIYLKVTGYNLDRIQLQIGSLIQY